MSSQQASFSDIFLFLLILVGLLLILKYIMNHYEKKEKDARKRQEESLREALEERQKYEERLKESLRKNEEIEVASQLLENQLEAFEGLCPPPRKINNLNNKNSISKRKEKKIDYSNYNKINVYPIDEQLIYLSDEDYYILEDLSTIIIPTRVSILVETYFQKFNSEYMAEREAVKRGLKDPQQVLDEWDCIGCESRELGIFLHEQIENYLQKKPINATYRFIYKSEYVSVNQNYDINKELSLFKNFIQDYDIIPYRSNWSIIDETYMVAGTIDLLSKQKDNSFILYDWKRSKKIGWEWSEKFYIDSNNYGKYGFDGLCNVPDNRFNRYCLQQNLYKYILEKNYDIRVNKMFLVILHPNYSKYHLLEVPNMQKEVMLMLREKDNMIENNRMN